MKDNGVIRQFNTGATRDTSQDKLSYYKALDPLVLERYLEYLNRHRVQPDGNIRDWDNWKKGIDISVYADSGIRHVFDVWKLLNGYDAEDNHGKVELEDAICAIIFNFQGMLYEIQKQKRS